MRTWIKCILVAIFAAGFCAGMWFIAVESRKIRDSQACNRLEVNMMDTLRFFREDDVRDIISGECGPFMGQRTVNVNLDAIESALLSKDYVTGVEAWVTDDCLLHVRLWQRMPEIKIVPVNRDSCYVDGDGLYFPLCEEFEVGVPEIGGIIPDDPHTIRNLLEFAEFSKRTGWEDRYSKIELDKNGDLSIWLEGMEEQFILGSVSDLEDKMSRIDRYIDKVSGKNKYSIISVKYSNQIICRKKDI